MRSIFRKTAALLMALVILVCAAGCAAPVPSGPAAVASAVTDLMKGITASNKTEDPQALANGGPKAADFAARLIKACYKDGENTLVSPLSVLCALAMTANGADRNTLAQMEKTLGMDTAELNSFFLSYMKTLASKKNGKLSLANSIWFTDDKSFEADQRFLQTNADYFKAELYKTRFDGTDAPKNAINGWVKEKTDGMIPEIIDRIPDNIIMYLINALAFDAEWQEIYYERQVRDGQFTNAGEQKKTVPFMYSQEHEYLETANATGFIKNYKGGDYAFVALLPKEGSTVAELVASLDGEALTALLASPEGAQVQAAIPKFETKYSAELSKVLSAMGMPEAFDEDRADFSRMGKAAGNIYISRVLHKTFISVNEKGTRAGAATAVEMDTKSAAPFNMKRVYLDRPFVYMLIDRTTNVPFFIGVMNEM